VSWPGGIPKGVVTDNVVLQDNMDDNDDNLGSEPTKKVYSAEYSGGEIVVYHDKRENGFVVADGDVENELAFYGYGPDISSQVTQKLCKSVAKNYADGLVAGVGGALD